MEDLEQLEHYCGLSERFKEIEAESETLTANPANNFLCTRIDGIGLSKKYLKESISNGHFDNLMRATIQNTYDVIRRKSPSNAQNTFLCILVCSDEVSLIFNTQENYYKNRIFKIVTTLASTFSSFFTSNGFRAFQSKKTPRFSGAFDGRPIVLKSIEEVVSYLKTRYAVYIRNTSTKLLRINGLSSDDIYHKDNYNNIDFVKNEINKRDLDREQSHIAKYPRLFIPNETGELCEYKFNTLSEFSDQSFPLINNFNNWVIEKNRITSGSK